MAWLEAKGGRDVRAAAAVAAEGEAVATSMDPVVERDTLEDMVDAFNEARTNGDDRSRKRVHGAIEAVLEAQLKRRIELTERAYERLRGEPRRCNKAVDELLKMAMDEHWFGYLRTEHAFLDGSGAFVFVPSPRPIGIRSSQAAVTSSTRSTRHSVMPIFSKTTPSCSTRRLPRGSLFEGRS